MTKIIIRDYIGEPIEFGPGDIPCDVICNGFSIRETILSVLEKRLKNHEDCSINDLANDITELLSIKLRLKQGYIHDPKTC